MKLAAQESIVPGESVAEQLRNLENCGYEAVELVHRFTIQRPEETKSALVDSPIEALSMCTSLEHDLADVGANLADRISFFKETMDFASQFGVKRIISVPVRGPLAEGVTEQQEIDRYRDALRTVGEHAESLGMVVVIEPLIRYETHLINRLEQAVEMAESVGSRGVGIMADFFHMNVEEADIAQSVTAAGRWIRHVHLADSNRLNPGRGHTDFEPGMRALKSIGFDGAMALECRLADGPPLTELRHSSDHLSSFAH